MKKTVCSLLILTVALFTIFLTGCKEEASKPQPNPALADQLLIPPQALRDVGLEYVFSYVVPIRPGEKIKNFEIIGDRFYVISGRNYLTSLDRHALNPVYNWQIAPPETIFCGLREFDNQLYSIVGADLVAFDQAEGKVLMKNSLGFSPLCSPARNNNFYYVPGTDDRVHAFRAADMVRLFDVSANDGGLITTVQATNDFVVFATTAGTIAAIQPDSPTQIWRFEAADAVNAPVAYDGKRFVFSSKDACIYSISAATGKLQWKYLTSAILTNAPQITDSFVYQFVDGRGLLALKKVNGELAWQMPDGLALLAEDGRRVCIMAKNKKLLVYDNVDNKIINEIDVPGITRWATNTRDNLIYLGDDAGRIA
ncbi:MAG: PQQ-binding-like beta-propeller repeat protein, partial [Phycisphaerae bacterium]